MDTVSVSLDVLAGFIGKTSSELQSALMIDGQDGKKVPAEQVNIDKIVADSLRTRVSDQKKSNEKEFSSMGKRVAYEEIESYLVENHGIQKGTDWKSGISAVVAEAKTKAQTSEEVIKTSEVYKAAVAKAEQAEQALQKTKTDFREFKVNQSLESELSSILNDETLALALPDDKVIREIQLKAFRNHLLQQAKLDPNDKGEIVPTGVDGKPLEDPNFLPVTLRSFITTNAKTFWPTKQAQPGRESPPAGDPAGKGNPPGGEGGNKFPKFASAEEFSAFTDKAIIDGKDGAYLKEATAAFESQTT